MAYPNYKYEVLLTPTAETITTSGDKGISWSPGLVPHIVRGFSVIWTSSDVAASGNEQVRLMINDHTSGSTASQVVAIVGQASSDQGIVQYTATLDQTVSPGQFLRVNCPAIATGSGLFQAVVYVEVSPEEPGNVTDMRQTSAT